MSLIIYKKGMSKIPSMNSYISIVKIQKAFNEDKVLVYNREKTFIDEFNGNFNKYLKNRMKAYFKVKIKNGNMKILKEVEHNF